MNYEETLARLCAIGAPSGFERPMAQAAAELLRPVMDEVKIDKMGSVVAVRRCGKENAPRLLLDAHLDEIGFIITGHEEGFLRFAPLGGVDPRMLPDRELTILTQPPITGVVACMPPHVLSDEERDKSLPIQELFIDAGLSQEQAKARIPVGTPAVYRAGCAPLGEHKLCGKALDDRACLAVLIDAARQLLGEKLDVDLYILGSVQEEVHGTGAITAAYGIVPDLCVAVDVTHGSSPDAPKDETFPLGGGPTVGLGPNCTKWMGERFCAKAEELSIPYSVEVMPGHSGTNGWDLQITREGVATAVLSVPLRYMHTPLETIHRDDLTAAARLLAAFVKDLGKEVPTYA